MWSETPKPPKIPSLQLGDMQQKNQGRPESFHTKQGSLANYPNLRNPFTTRKILAKDTETPYTCDFIHFICFIRPKTPDPTLPPRYFIGKPMGNGRFPALAVAPSACSSGTPARPASERIATWIQASTTFDIVTCQTLKK